MSDMPDGKLSEEEKLELSRLFFEDKESFRSTVMELCTKAVMRELFDCGRLQSQVKAMFDNMVESVVAECFGVERSSYTRKFSGPWADKVRELVRAGIEAHINKFDPKKDVWTAEQMRKLRRQWVVEYKQTFEHAVTDAAANEARRDAESFLQELKAAKKR
jgi:hypothetical protein